MSNSSIVKLGSLGTSYRKLEGVVAEKDGMVTVEHKLPGMVKTKTSSFPSNTLPAYMVGTPGFVLAPSNEPIAQVVGKMSVGKEGRLIVATEAGKVVINQIAGISISTDEVEADSREARQAERASKIKAKLPRSQRAEKTSSKKSSRSSKEAAAPSKKSTDKSKARTEAVVKSKKKKNRDK